MTGYENKTTNYNFILGKSCENIFLYLFIFYCLFHIETTKR